MTVSSTPVGTITLDLKKYRIRIHKTTLHLIGDPKHLQFLIQPEHKIFAIMAVTHPCSKDHSLIISKDFISTDCSVEIYSLYFLTKLLEIAPELKDGNSYRISGTLIPEDKLFVFPLNRAERLLENEGGIPDDG